MVTNEFHSECSSSTSWNSQPDTEDDRMIALVLTEEYSQLDGAVGRRLSNLAPIPVRSQHFHFYNTIEVNAVNILGRSLIVRHEFYISCHKEDVS